MASLLFYMSATVLFAQSTVAFNCSINPIYVDIHKRAVHGTDIFQYGSFIGVGTPAQNQSLWPSLSQNITSFASLSYCTNNSTTLKECTKSTGGFFDASTSDTFRELEDFNTLDNDRNGTFDGAYGRDNMHLYTHYFETDGASETRLTDVTIEIAQKGDIAPSIVGIGRESTVLDALYAQGLITGKTYALYIGHGFDRAKGAVNGSNVFGGYDSGRFTGEVHKYPMSPDTKNPMTVRVKDIIINDAAVPNGEVSLFDQAAFPDMKSTPTPFQAEITTDQYPLALPYQITQNFIKHLDAQKDNYWGDNSLKLKSQFNGSLSIVLDDGFTVTLPSEVLSNWSNITPIQDRDENSTSPNYLSTAFLGQIYLMADYEDHSFYLAEAVQKNNMVMPVSWCPKTGAPQAYQRPQQNAWIKQGLIGAVVGGILGGIGISVCAYCFIVAYLRKREEKKIEKDLERSKAAKIEQMEIEEAPEFEGPPKTPKTATPFFWKKRRS
ncbi:acid protease [Lojkania enalia]|uniref:Acid protease n=1 Tax=Lojkania enalia TaxID=147567 RepID=A0A9P4KFG3_9PLEO|nr:acid protease [Didymosphaeria enalia]